ncbi:hypothetical protein ASC66_09445 [Leifsonia sp. Root4]|nr:hypothetical protein ASC66_09445 [Leifsonia sp. Root4]
MFLFVCAYAFRFSLNNIDGISYISIAEQYAAGQFDIAVNAYWSPMISWLLAPLLASGLNGPQSFMLINALSASIGVGVGSWYLWKRTNRHFWATFLFLATSVVFFSGSSFILTPDSLVAVWVIVFLVTLSWLDDILDSPEVSTRRLWACGAVLGIVGALGYFIKLFIVPLLVATLIVWFVIRLVTARKGTFWDRARSTTLVLVSSVVIAAVVCAPWVLALSLKYDEPTIGTSFSVNINKKFDPNANSDQVTPLELEAPPNEHAVSSGEDRLPPAGKSSGATISTESADPGSADKADSEISVLSRAKYYVKERLAAFPHYVTKIGTIAPFAFATLIVFALLLLFGFINYRKNRYASLAALIGGVYFVGYAAITSASSGGGNTRYYWPVFLLTVMMVSLSVPRMWASLVSRRAGAAKLTAFVLIIALLPAAAFWQHGLGRSAPFAVSAGSVGVKSLLRDGGVPPIEQTFAEAKLSTHIPPGSKIVGSNYRTSLKFAYFLDAQIYGNAGDNFDISDRAVHELLSANNIDFYLDFTPLASNSPDFGQLGSVIARYVAKLPCADVKGAPPRQCVITVVEVGN